MAQRTPFFCFTLDEIADLFHQIQYFYIFKNNINRIKIEKSNGRKIILISADLNLNVTSGRAVAPIPFSLNVYGHSITNKKT